MERRDGGAGGLGEDEAEAWGAYRDARYVERWVQPTAFAVFLGLFGGFAIEVMRQYQATASPALGHARSFDPRNKERVRFMSRVMAKAALRGAGGMGVVVGGFHAARLGLERYRGVLDAANYAMAAAPVGCSIAVATSSTRAHAAMFRRGLSGALMAGVIFAPVGYVGAIVDTTDEEDARDKFLEAFRAKREAAKKEEEERLRGESMVAETGKALRLRAEYMDAQTRAGAAAQARPARRTWMQWLKGEPVPIQSPP